MSNSMTFNFLYYFNKPIERCISNSMAHLIVGYSFNQPIAFQSIFNH